MIKLCIFSDFCSPTINRKMFCDTYDIQNFKYKNIIIVNDDIFTHAIIINIKQHKLKIPKENVLGLAHEPYRHLRIHKKKDFVDYAKKHIGLYFLGKRIPILPKLFKCNYSFMKHIPFQPINNKKYRISMIISNKKKLSGHIYRHKLINKILKSSINVHIYGKGSNSLNNIKNDKRIKGKFKNDEPYKEYNYTIVIENTLSESYISEKYCNPISCNCIPIYLGATNIEKVFGKECCIKLSGNLETDFKLINNISQNYKENLINLNNARYHLKSGNAYLPNFLITHWGEK